MSDNQETPPEPKPFDFSAYPADTIFHDRRSGKDRRDDTTPTPENLERRKKVRRTRIDPTTFDKNYTADELEFMHSVDRYRVLTGRQFLVCSDYLDIAYQLGYRQLRNDQTGEPEAVLAGYQFGPETTPEYCN